MRAGRLVSLLLLLQTRGRMTAQELADELEVSVRTVYRDVESLGASGVPIYADRGPTGGYQLLDGYRTRLTGLTGDEAGTLFLAGVPGPAAELGLGSVLAAAELKLRASLPGELADRADRVRERFHLDAPGWFRGDEPTPHLATVADAVWSSRRLSVRYRRWKAPREVTRTLSPLGVVLKAGRWYLVAGAGRRGSRRTGCRTSSTRWCSTSRSTGPPGFDLAAFWREWTERYESSVYTASATVRMTDPRPGHDGVRLRAGDVAAGARLGRRAGRIGLAGHRGADRVDQARPHRTAQAGRRRRGAGTAGAAGAVHRRRPAAWPTSTREHCTERTRS